MSCSNIDLGKDTSEYSSPEKRFGTPLRHFINFSLPCSGIFLWFTIKFSSVSISVILFIKPDSMFFSRSVSFSNSILLTFGDERLVIFFVTNRGTSADGGSKPIRKTHLPIPYLSFFPPTAT